MGAVVKSSCGFGSWENAERCIVLMELVGGTKERNFLELEVTSCQLHVRRGRAALVQGEVTPPPGMSRSSSQVVTLLLISGRTNVLCLTVEDVSFRLNLENLCVHISHSHNRGTSRFGIELTACAIRIKPGRRPGVRQHSFHAVTPMSYCILTEW